MECILEQVATDSRIPGDKCYVHNFDNADQPLILYLPAGKGASFRKDMAYLIEYLDRTVPAVLESEEFQSRRNQMMEREGQKGRELIREFEERIKKENFVLVEIRFGPVTKTEIAPLVEGKPRSGAELAKMLAEGKLAREEFERIDEAQVGDELRASRVLVRSASNLKEAVALVREHSEAGERVVVITDLRMSTSTGRSFYGGFELVRRLKKNGFNPPVLLMTERLSEKARARAMELGITKVAFKPSISKLDPEEYKTDLRGFASLLMRQLTDLTVTSLDADEPSKADPQEDSLLLDFVTSMTEQLMSPQRSLDISYMYCRLPPST